MSAIDINRTIESAIDIVREAHDKHKLQELTKAKVREEVERKMGLEAGALDEKPYKKRINEVVAATVEELKARKSSDSGDGQTKEEGIEEPVKPSSSGKKRKSKSNDAEDAASKKRKPKSSDAAASHRIDEDKAKGRKQKRKDSTKDKVSKEKGKTFSNGKVSTKEKTEIVKSMEIVESDGEDESVPKDEHLSPGSTTSTKRKGKRAIDSDIEDEAELSTSPKRRRKSDHGPPELKKAPESRATKKTPIDEPEEEKVDGKADDSETKSDSELSVLIDEPPTRKKKESKKKSRGNPEKKSRSKKETKDVSTSEEQIKKLKSLVVACGVRKVWSKELKDCETPSSQIAHLRKLLMDLGMKGRLSLEQAKAIKAKRDLEREMADVQEFAQRYADDRPKCSPVVGASTDEEDEDAHPSRRPRTAHQSIMDFLGDQSDSD